MIHSRERDIILEELGKFPSEGRCKLQSSVGDYLRVEAKSGEDMREKELGHSCHIDVLFARAVDYPLSKHMVYHNHDSIKSIGFGESHNEVDGNGREWNRRVNR